MVKDYLNTLKIKGGFTTAEISKLSGIPEATVRKILSGETADPRFETIVKLVESMGGSMDDIAGSRKNTEIETNAVIALKDAYESRIEEMTASYDTRISDLKEYVASLKQEKKTLAIVAIALVFIIVGLFVFDIALGTHGWVQY